MKSDNMFSLAEAAQKMAATARDILLTMEGIISELCWLVKDRARERSRSLILFGTRFRRERTDNYLKQIKQSKRLNQRRRE
jgi:hypothetical protein